MKSGKQTVGQVVGITLAAAVEEGSIVCRNAAGTGVVGADSASITTAGMALCDGAIGEVVRVYQARVLMLNGTSGEAFDGTELPGTPAYVIDAETVGKVGGSHQVVAGLFVSLLAEGVLMDMSPAAIAAAKLAVPGTHVADVVALTGTLTGTVNGALVDVAATAGACAGGATPTATQVDTAIATAVATIVTGVNEQNKELMTTLNAAVAKANAILAALETKGVLKTS